MCSPQYSVFALATDSKLFTYSLFLFQLFTHHFNYIVSNFTFDALFSCLPASTAIFWEFWELSANYNAKGRVFRKKAWSRNMALHSLEGDFSIGIDLGWAKHFTLSLSEANLFMMRCLKELCYTRKNMHGSLMHSKKKKKSCWLRLIKGSAFQFLITLLCVLGRWDMGKKSIKAKLVALCSASVF